MLRTLLSTSIRSFTKRQACIAIEYGEALRAAGLTDPFTELTEPPEAASRWRLHRYHDRHDQAS